MAPHSISGHLKPLVKIFATISRPYATVLATTIILLSPKKKLVLSLLLLHRRQIQASKWKCIPTNPEYNFIQAILWMEEKLANQTNLTNTVRHSVSRPRNSPMHLIIPLSHLLN